MRCILRKETDPYFNLAAEEYIFKNFPEDTFMLWSNDPSVIIGKHQNAFAEVNHEFIRMNEIPVIRRISGGGAVYHDKGNLNFTITGTGDQESLVDFQKHMQPIINAINNLGVKLDIGNRNSLFINGMKVSGNAEHVFKKKVIHHGTILFNSNLENLNKAISPPAIQYLDKSVKSLRSNVTNLSLYIPEPMTMDDFSEYIISEILNTNKNGHRYTLTEIDKMEIQKLKEEKYKTWDWNYGYSPPFSFNTNISLDHTNFLVTIKVKNGIIEDIIGESNTNGASEIKKLIDILVGSQLRESSITLRLKEVYPTNILNGIIHSLFIGDEAEHLINLNV